MATLKEIHVPDIGNASNVDVIEVNVKPGQTIAKEDAMITLESDKATLEIPAPEAGVVKEVKIKVGDKVSKGTLVLMLEPAQESGASESKPAPAQAAAATAPSSEKSAPAPATNQSAAMVGSDEDDDDEVSTSGDLHAGPGVRRLARELGVNLDRINGSGPKSRILKEDVQAFVKNELTRIQSGVSGGSGQLGLPTAPSVDFTQFGEIEVKSLTRIKKLTGSNLHRNWLVVPHVTQFDEADITDLEDFRQAQKKLAESKGVKLTPLVFIMKAVVAGLKAYPSFNASLDPNGESLILKKYFHLGVAVDTPEGLVVPVIRNVDQKGIIEIAQELAEVSAKARNKMLSPNDMQGSCFTISSLGGIGGTAFTPIVNVPDVAILGVSKSQIKPVYQNDEFVPRLMLPLSLSYDHRVIDGAEGARFITYLSSVLSDIRKLLF